VINADGKKGNGPTAYNCASVVKMEGTRGRSESGGDKQNMVSPGTYCE
jgi:hypothetical protein